jgi:hypothetical protein
LRNAAPNRRQQLQGLQVQFSQRHPADLQVQGLQWHALFVSFSKVHLLLARER